MKNKSLKELGEKVGAKEDNVQIIANEVLVTPDDKDNKLLSVTIDSIKIVDQDSGIVDGSSDKTVPVLLAGRLYTNGLKGDPTAADLQSLSPKGWALVQIPDDMIRDEHLKTCEQYSFSVVVQSEEEVSELNKHAPIIKFDGKEMKDITDE